MGRAAWHAPNPAQRYDAYITEEGVSLALNKTSYVSLSLRQMGYGAALRAVPAGDVTGQQQTVTIEREGVKEWFTNGEGGLEQGFTLAEPPGARNEGEKLHLLMAVGNGWRAQADEDGRRVVLLGKKEGEVIEYSRLVVWDANGQMIPARLKVEKNQVVIEVEDADANYPLTIDLVFSLQQKLTASDGAADDGFGSSVAISGHTVVVGAPGDDIGGNQNQGSAYIFVRSGANWIQQQKLTASDGVADGFFGSSVAISGETVAIGTERFINNSRKGSVYVFMRNGTTWNEQ